MADPDKRLTIIDSYNAVFLTCSLSSDTLKTRPNPCISTFISYTTPQQSPPTLTPPLSTTIADKMVGCGEDHQNLGSDAVIRKADQSLMELQQEQTQRVEALGNERRVEDKAARIAKEAGVSRVRKIHCRKGVMSCPVTIYRMKQTLMPFRYRTVSLPSLTCVRRIGVVVTPNKKRCVQSCGIVDEYAYSYVTHHVSKGYWTHH